MKETIYKYNSHMRIALLSDLHDRPIEQIINSLKLRKPDIICIAGDIMYRCSPSDNELLIYKTKYVLPFLEACTKIAPSFMSLGNHEYMLCNEDLNIMSQTGITILDKTWCEHNGIIIGGLSSAIVTAYQKYRKNNLEHYPRWTPTNSIKPDVSWLNEFCKYNKYHLLLCHHPEYRDLYLKNMPIDMILCGHAHGGQIRLFEKDLFAPGQGIFPKYTRGIHENMIISTGLSNTANLIPRIFNPEEIVYIEPY